MAKRSFSVHRLTFTAMLFAAALVLSFFEGILPLAGVLPPGVKPGLSNIVTMYCLFFLGAPSAFTVALLKGFFVFLTRGATAGLLSTAGGLFSVLMMLLILRLLPSFSKYTVSLIGAVCHNIGQLVVTRFLFGNAMVYGYLPILLISGVVMGLVTGIILRAIYPALQRIPLK